MCVCVRVRVRLSVRVRVRVCVCLYGSAMSVVTRLTRENLPTYPNSLSQLLRSVLVNRPLHTPMPTFLMQTTWPRKCIHRISNQPSQRQVCVCVHVAVRLCSISDMS